MGRERTGAGKRIYLCLASLIFFPLLGCAALKAIDEPRESRQPFLRSHRLLAKGDFEGALNENQKALSADSAQGDEALFNLGLLYAHYGNPKRDYGKSLAFFEKLVKDYPQSPRVEQAKIWVGVLGVIEKSKQVDIELEERKKEHVR